MNIKACLPQMENICKFILKDKLQFCKMVKLKYKQIDVDSVIFDYIVTVGVYVEL